MITKLVIGIATCLLKAGRADTEDMAVARQWLCKLVSTATNSRDRSIRYERNNRGIVGGVLCWVRAEAISGGPVDSHYLAIPSEDCNKARTNEHVEYLEDMMRAEVTCGVYAKLKSVVIICSSSSSISLSCDRSIASSKVLERDCPGKVIMW
jgi:hypothetical protein